MGVKPMTAPLTSDQLKSMSSRANTALDPTMGMSGVCAREFYVRDIPKLLSEIDRLQGVLKKAEWALERIKDGGAPQGIDANAIGRMLWMCDMAAGTILQIRGKK